MQIFFLCLYGDDRPRLDLEYPVYGAHKLADEGTFTCQFSFWVLPRPGFEGEASIMQCNLSLIYAARQSRKKEKNEFWSHIEVVWYADAKLFLPHASVKAFTSESTSKPAPPYAGFQEMPTSQLPAPENADYLRLNFFHVHQDWKNFNFAGYQRPCPKGLYT